ncbi:hypothetical protein [Paenibacillus sp. DMB5]|uniref:hypothetical protein n=1 Tax=Paenibacillus sp. DMB5 TaxID=1780103 RepID=UPI00076D023B|nr:hypothetical protein [Paenibacillus sp. DMB5]KUP25806.1 hypothetical protein AWJ19_19475 [Paenibacillus sp. DMB5]
MKIKFSILYLVSLALLSGCTGSPNEAALSSTSKPQSTAKVQPSPFGIPTQPASSAPENETVTEQPEVNDAETVLKEYADAFIEKRFDDLKPLIYPNNFNITADELVQRIKENDFKKSISYSEYMITSITDYDETHKMAKLLVKPSDGSTALEDTVGLVFSDNSWKVDLALIVRTESNVVNISSNNNEVTVTKVTKVTKLNGYEFNIEYKNNLSDNRLVIGWMNNSFALLKTEKGQLTEQLRKANVGPQATGSVIATFITQEKASVKNLIIQGVHIADSNNLPVPGEDKFDINIPLQ